MNDFLIACKQACIQQNLLNGKFFPSIYFNLRPLQTAFFAPEAIKGSHWPTMTRSRAASGIAN